MQFTVRLKAPTIDFTLRLGVFSPSTRCPTRRFEGYDGVRPAPDRQRPVPTRRRARTSGLATQCQTRPGHQPRLPRQPDAAEQGAAVRLLRQPGHRLRRPAVEQSRCAGHDSAQRAAGLPQRTWATTRPARPQRSTRPSTLRCGCRISAARRAGCAASRCRPRSTVAQICQQIFAGARAPARDFTASSLPGFDPHIDGNDALNFDPDRARRLWSQADAISTWTGQYAIAYNADGSPSGMGGRGGQQHQERARHRRRRRASAHLRRVPDPDHQPHASRPRSAPGGRATSRRCWSSLEPLFVTGAGADDVGYSNPGFDAALAAAEAAPDLPQSFTLANARTANPVAGHARCAAVVHHRVAGRSSAVSHVALTWNGLPDYEHIVKA